MAYHNFSLQAKDLVNDADKVPPWISLISPPPIYVPEKLTMIRYACQMDIVVKACQTEFIKLKLTTNNAKARLNAHRLGWGRLGYHHSPKKMS